MRVTICELPHDPAVLATAWTGLSRHTAQVATELVLLPEFAFVEPVWETEKFDPVRWASAEAQCNAWLARLPELGARYVVGTRPVTHAGGRFNEGFLWSAATSLMPLRRKFFLPDETGGWESNWFDRGDTAFPTFRAGDLSFGLNICSELWALETYATYAAQKVGAILAPRATAASTAEKWLSVGVTAAVRSGAFCVSSNRVDPTGACGGASWIINPDGKILARTSTAAPFATVDLDLTAPIAAHDSYPRSLFRS